MRARERAESESYLVRSFVCARVCERGGGGGGASRFCVRSQHFLHEFITKERESQNQQ